MAATAVAYSPVLLHPLVPLHGPRRDRVASLVKLTPPRNDLFTRSAPSRRRPVVCSTSPPFRLFDRLPVELVERILRYLELEELLLLKRVDSKFNALLSTNLHIFRTITLTWRPSLNDPTALSSLAALLPGTRHLTLRAFPAAALERLLRCVDTDRLVSLDLSHSTTGHNALQDAFSTSSSDGPVAPSPVCWPNLHRLILRDVKSDDPRADLFPPLSHSLSSPSSALPSPTPFPSLLHLDLSYSSLSLLSPLLPSTSTSSPSSPLSLTQAFPALTSLALDGCRSLAPSIMLRDLPSRLEELSLGYCGLGEEVLRELGTGEGEGETGGAAAGAAGGDRAGDPTPFVGRPALRLDLRGNDSLTRRDIASLLLRWEAGDGGGGIGRMRRVEVVHDPVLLESDDEEDVRAFVEMVARAVVVGRRGRG
ncbi:hypothetical protein JCM6882_008390 [Rhodosporidiobolus microsporus]